MNLFRKLYETTITHFYNNLYSITMEAKGISDEISLDNSAFIDITNDIIYIIDNIYTTNTKKNYVSNIYISNEEYYSNIRYEMINTNNSSYSYNFNFEYNKNKNILVTRIYTTNISIGHRNDYESRTNMTNEEFQSLMDKSILYKKECDMLLVENLINSLKTDFNINRSENLKAILELDDVE